MTDKKMPDTNVRLKCPKCSATKTVTPAEQEGGTIGGVPVKHFFIDSVCKRCGHLKMNIIEIYKTDGSGKIIPISGKIIPIKEGQAQ